MVITSQMIRDRLFFNGPSTMVNSDSIVCLDGVYSSKLRIE